jgi:putative redox protein
MTKPKTLRASLEWGGELRFEASAGERRWTLDGNNREGFSPMESLLVALSGCMAIDVALILEKGRAGLESLRVHAEGDRADNPPRRFTRLRLAFQIRGARLRKSQVERAIRLSREKYCSVWHTLNPDIELDITFAIEPLRPQD